MRRPDLNKVTGCGTTNTEDDTSENPTRSILSQALLAAVILMPVAGMFWQVIHHFARSAERPDLVVALIQLAKIRPQSAAELSRSTILQISTADIPVEGLQAAFRELESDVFLGPRFSAKPWGNFQKSLVARAPAGSWAGIARVISDRGRLIRTGRGSLRLVLTTDAGLPPEVLFGRLAYSASATPDASGRFGHFYKWLDAHVSIQIVGGTVEIEQLVGEP